MFKPSGLVLRTSQNAAFPLRQMVIDDFRSGFLMRRKIAGAADSHVRRGWPV